MSAQSISGQKKHPAAPPVWLLAAQAEKGVSTFPTGQSNPRITGYHAHTALRGYDDKASWCSSFVNWTFAQVGIRGTGSALARSWLDWGRPLEHPVPGCVVVLYRDDPNSGKAMCRFICARTKIASFCLAETSLTRRVSTTTR